MSEVLEAIVRSRIVAIVRLPCYDRALEVAHALLEGGIEVIEFTLTGVGAYQAIRSVRAALGESVQVGVGTVLEPGAVRESIDAGAQFVVTPIADQQVIAACKVAHVPLLCGALTPTEAMMAHRAGADLIKIFPARLGGPQYLRDLLAPLPQLRLVPTGGVSAENARAYLDAGAVAVAIGGNLISVSAVSTGDWEQITVEARRCVEAIG